MPLFGSPRRRNYSRCEIPIVFWRIKRFKARQRSGNTVSLNSAILARCVTDPTYSSRLRMQCTPASTRKSEKDCRPTAFTLHSKLVPFLSPSPLSLPFPSSSDFPLADFHALLAWRAFARLRFLPSCASRCPESDLHIWAVIYFVFFVCEYKSLILELLFVLGPLSSPQRRFGIVWFRFAGHEFNAKLRNKVNRPSNRIARPIFTVIMKWRL